MYQRGSNSEMFSVVYKVTKLTFGLMFSVLVLYHKIRVLFCFFKFDSKFWQFLLTKVRRKNGHFFSF